MSKESKALHMVRLRIDPAMLAAFAAREKLLDDDLGYALHVAFRRRFGAAGPQPMRVLETTSLDTGAGVPVSVLGYTDRPDALVVPVATLPDWTDDWSAEPLNQLLVETPAVRPMPSRWSSGDAYGFDVQIRPVRRASSGVRSARGATGAAAKAGERDAFLCAVNAATDDTPIEREAVYRSWLAERLGDAAQLDHCTMTRFRRTAVRRSAHAKGGTRSVEGPEALMSGGLRIGDPDAFDRLLRRGVGRHVAFGYGMLLLRPGGDR